MGLSKKSVQKARTLLMRVNPKIVSRYILEQDLADIKNTVVKPDRILGYDPSVGGWENIYMDVKDITLQQLEKFNKGAKKIPNTSFCKELGEGITRIGFI